MDLLEPLVILLLSVTQLTIPLDMIGFIALPMHYLAHSNKTFTGISGMLRCAHLCHSVSPNCIAFAYHPVKFLCRLSGTPAIPGADNEGFSIFQVPGMILPTPEVTTTTSETTTTTTQTTTTMTPPPFTKPDAYVYNPASDTCFMRYNNNDFEMNWDDAKAACENEGYDVRFAKFDTKEAVEFIRSLYTGGDNDWFNLNIGLRKVSDIWCWNMDTNDPLTYEDQWMAPVNNDGVCGNFYEWDQFGFVDHLCSDIIGYICEDIHCYLL